MKTYLVISLITISLYVGGMHYLLNESSKIQTEITTNYTNEINKANNISNSL